MKCKHSCACKEKTDDGDDDDDDCPHSYTFEVNKLPAIAYSALVINKKVKFKNSI